MLKENLPSRWAQSGFWACSHAKLERGASLVQILKGGETKGRWSAPWPGA